jgi:hypothetical protein
MPAPTIATGRRSCHRHSYPEFFGALRASSVGIDSLVQLQLAHFSPKFVRAFPAA